MPTRDYEIKYDASSAVQAAAQINGLVAALNALAAAQAGVNNGAAQAQQNLQGMQAPAQQGAGAIQALGNQMLALRAGMLVVSEAKQALEAFVEAADKANERAVGKAEKGLQQRDKAREYANLLNKSSPDDEVMARLFGVATGSGMDFNEALKFGEQFLGSAPAGRQKGHSNEAIEKLLEAEAARFSARVGLDPGTGGDVAGVVSQYVDLTKDARGRPLTAEQGMLRAMGQLGGLAYGINEGRGKMTPGMRSALSAAASMVGSEEGSPFRDLAEIGAVVGVASTVAKTSSSSGTLVKQAGRLVERARLSDDPEVKALGITDKDDFASALEKLTPLITGASGNRWLIENGMHNSTERDSIRALAKNADVIRQRRAKARQLADDGGSVVEADRQFLLSLTGQNRIGAATAEAGAFAAGQPGQALQAARKTARGRLDARGELDSMGNLMWDRLYDFSMTPARLLAPLMGERVPYSEDQRVDEEVFRALSDQSRKAGIDLAERYPGKVARDGRGGFRRNDQMPDTLAKMVNELAPELEKKGLGFGGGDGQAAEKIDKAADKFDRAADKIVGALGGGGGGMPPVGVIGGPRMPHRGGG